MIAYDTTIPVDPTRIVKKSVRVAGHPTSVSLEAAFWPRLQEQAARNGQSLNALITTIDQSRTGSLSSALRVFVLEQCGTGP